MTEYALYIILTMFKVYYNDNNFADKQYANWLVFFFYPNVLRVI